MLGANGAFAGALEGVAALEEKIVHLKRSLAAFIARNAN